MQKGEIASCSQKKSPLLLGGSAPLTGFRYYINPLSYPETEATSVFMVKIQRKIFTPTEGGVSLRIFHKRDNVKNARLTAILISSWHDP